MTPISLEPELYERVERAATELHSSVEQIVNEAARQYLWELDRQKISEESRRYRERHSEIKRHYLGKYIAMRDGNVVDSDSDFGSLRTRIRQRFGGQPVLMTQVEEVAEPVLTRRGFRLEHNSK